MNHLDRFNLVESEEGNGNRFEASTIDKLINEILQFRNERNWKKFHNPKDLAISLSYYQYFLLPHHHLFSIESSLITHSPL